uniref:Uncharacterized protein n=1 Tax=Haptolina brevifila TaxID=156173 RepID=A0A7S2BK82_9EUKA|mmetsp:Transcript_13623/g.27403  ORF Transcript_13623/g.27403 Transcript_13623/m.27403 type:complete len:180 (+) Transcript_13623:275-814(+)
MNETSRPDPRWYHSSGGVRWDHMYMRADPSGGYIGYVVSAPLNASAFAPTWPGVMRSEDGIAWKAHAPLNVSWGGMVPQGIEEGGVEKLTLSDGSSRFFLIGGQGGHGSCYSMWAFSSARSDAGFSPVQHRFRLSGGGGPRQGWGNCYMNGALAVWARGPNKELLLSQYMTARGGSAAR